METEHIPEPAAGDTATTRPGLGRGTLLLMSVAAGLSVAGNYFAQPLLDVIGRDLHLSASTAALVVTVAQVGYGLGLLLLVPLGDLLERRRLAVTLTAATAVFLTVTASAPNAALLLTGTALTGLASVAAQVVVPYAATLAAPAERGRTVGTVMTGLLLGILLARTAAGLLAELGGWRTVYWVNAALMLLMAVLLRLRLPALRTTAGLRYPALLRSTLALFRQEPVLRWRGALGALTFAGFSVLWTALAFLMSGPPTAGRSRPSGCWDWSARPARCPPRWPDGWRTAAWHTGSPARRRSCCWVRGVCWPSAERAAPGPWPRCSPG